jgi:pseudouridine-5'-phosphate glycosidase
MLGALEAPDWLHVSPEVRGAIRERRAAVCLESAVITHGLPPGDNLQAARMMEAAVRSAGGVPATVAVIDGEIRLGLNHDELARLAESGSSIKAGKRDLGVAVARSLSAGTTVSATMYVAYSAGLPILATGGIGGVYPGPSGDVSMDLPELGRTPVAVVCSGAKSIMDLPRTLEWLETAAVPVIGFRAAEFPAFYSSASGLPVPLVMGSAGEIAQFMRTHWQLGLRSGILICVPPPAPEAIPWEQMQAWIRTADADARRAGVHGKELTPYLLRALAQLSGGATLRVNRTLLENNARLACEVAVAFSEVQTPD